MRIEVTDNEFMQIVTEVCEYMPTASVTFRAIERKVKAMTERELYSLSKDDKKTIKERNQALFEYYESKDVPEKFRTYLKQI